MACMHSNFTLRRRTWKTCDPRAMCSGKARRATMKLSGPGSRLRVNSRRKSSSRELSYRSSRHSRRMIQVR
eukprot:278199-Prymnesium_polylepis.3